MDVSGLKWPVIIVVILGLGWLGTAGGVNYMYGQFTATTPGANPEQDIKDEEGLSKLGGYLMYTWQFQKANQVLQTSIDRYGASGKNYWHNQYRQVKCFEKAGNYQQAYNKLTMLANMNANSIDDRVPNRDNLSLRAQKLKEVHELQ